MLSARSGSASQSLLGRLDVCLLCREYEGGFAVGRSLSLSLDKS
jgi:hypothetical protein